MTTPPSLYPPPFTPRNRPAPAAAAVLAAVVIAAVLSGVATAQDDDSGKCVELTDVLAYTQATSTTRSLDL